MKMSGFQQSLKPLWEHRDVRFVMTSENAIRKAKAGIMEIRARSRTIIDISFRVCLPMPRSGYPDFAVIKIHYILINGL
jgi:hypothetical protein